MLDVISPLSQKIKMARNRNRKKRDSPVNPRIGGNLGFFRRSGLGFYDQKREEKRRGLNRRNQPARGEKARNQGEEAQCKRVVPSNQTRSEQSEPTIRKIR